MTNLPTLSNYIPIVDPHGRASWELHNFWNSFLQYLQKNIEDTVDAALTANWSQVADDNGLRPEDDATLGANWSTNLTNRPTELTDGRVAAGLNASGGINFAAAAHTNRNQDNIPDGTTYTRLPLATSTGTGASRRALIDFTQGHTNKSLANVDSAQNTKLNGIETGATVGADWSTNLTNRPTELTDGRITTALNSSGRLIKATNVFPAGTIGVKSTTNVTLSATDAGATATISVSAHSRKIGDVSSQTTVSYNSGSITGLSFSTKYFVYTDDATYAGGAVTYVATTNSDNLSARVGRVYVGEITTPADGGGNTGGTPPGNPGGGGGGTYLP